MDGADFREYERVTRKMVARFQPFVYGYYDPVFTREFCTKAPWELMRKAVTSTLAGDVERPGLKVLFWKTAMLKLVGLAQYLERFRGPAPA